MKLKSLMTFIALILLTSIIVPSVSAYTVSEDVYNSEEGLELYYSQFDDGEEEKLLDSKSEDIIQPECIACIAQPPKLSLVSTTRQNNVFVAGKTNWVYTADAKTIQYGTTITKTLTFSSGVTADIREKAKSQFNLTVSVSRSYSANYTFSIDKSKGSRARVAQYADQYNKRIKITKEYLGRDPEISYTNAYEPITTILGLQYQ
ncbi:hypothetical protein PZE06_16135 [Robertmurraya sp. DFI.2.37]|uniref:hypothetical protein n=1 Tax=Robertmurraya TaxID=2837507 RepID=UPI0010F900EB|nr:MULTISPECIES: hypothetical protein [Robertmurraya]MDF1509670.1 hypothetical protein [Robertmurraya sp. DFI.2.37]